MKRWRWLTFAGTVVAAMGATSYVLFSPKIGHASRAEIEAALPDSLKVVDDRDPDGEARYARLIALAKRLAKSPLKTVPGATDVTPAVSLPENERVLAEVEALLAEGPISAPPRTLNSPFAPFSDLKDLAKLVAHATGAAGKRGDRAACARWASLGLRLGQACVEAGGAVIDGLVAIAIDAIGVREAYAMEIARDFDAAGRERLLALLAPLDGTSPEMAAAIRRDFQGYFLPTLLDPQAHVRELITNGTYDGLDDDGEAPPIAGTFDPVATARLVGGVYDASMNDLMRRYPDQHHDADRMMEAASEALPSPSENYRFSRIVYRIRMNAGSNTLGRQAAGTGVVVGMGSATARRAANRNLLRATILLRRDGKAAVADPFGKGDLRFDPKRKIVWSVGTNGKDDGGDVGKGGEYGKRDLGYPYGDHSWPPNTISPGVPAIPATGSP